MNDVIGIDVGSYGIKMVALTGKSDARKVSQVGMVYNPVGQFLPADETQFNQLAETLHTFASEHKLLGKPVATALPESLTYTNIISMPFLSDAELASSIFWEAEQHIPVPLEEVRLEYQILSKPKKGAVGEKMQVLLVASKNTVVDRVIELFQQGGMELIYLESGLLSCYRALTASLPTDQGVAIMNMGALSTDILILEAGKMVLSYTIQTGGLVFTRAIEQGLGLTGQPAAEYKRTYGFDQDQLEGKVRTAMTPIMNVLVGEMRKAIQYYQSSRMGAGIRTIILTGGGGYLKGISPYFSQLFGVEVVVANPFGSMEAISGVQLPKDVAVYSVAS